MNEILKQFDDWGRQVSFHYADDTASGEWRLGSQLEAKCLKLFDDNPALQPEMRKLAKSFLWTLRTVRPDQ